MNKIIFITGPQACGKTLHGQALAQYLDYTVLVDTGRTMYQGKMIADIKKALEDETGKAGRHRVVVLTNMREERIRYAYATKYQNAEVQIRQFHELMLEYYRHTFPEISGMWEPFMTLNRADVVGATLFMARGNVASQSRLSREELEESLRRAKRRRTEAYHPSIHNLPPIPLVEEVHIAGTSENPVARKRYSELLDEAIRKAAKQVIDETLDASVRNILKDVIAAQQQETSDDNAKEEPVSRDFLRDNALELKRRLGRDVAWAALFVQGYSKLSEVPDEKVNEVAQKLWRVNNAALPGGKTTNIFSRGADE